MMELYQQGVGGLWNWRMEEVNIAKEHILFLFLHILDEKWRIYVIPRSRDMTLTHTSH